MMEYGGSELQHRRIARQKFVKRALLTVIALLLVLLFFKLGTILRSAAIFPIRQVYIYGNSVLSSGEVARAADLEAYRSMLAFSRRKAAAALLRDRRITGVQILKIFPETLKIYVIEKEKKMLLKSLKGAYWVSEDGTVLAPAEESVAAESSAAAESAFMKGPFITLILDNDDTKVGAPIQGFMAESVISSLKELEQEDLSLYRLIDSVSVGEAGIFVLLGKMRYRVYMGSTIDLAKFKKLRALLAVLGRADDPDRADDYARGDGGTMEIDMSFSHAVLGKGE